MKPINIIKSRIATCYVTITLCCLMQGCIKDDLSDCGLGVQFRYIKNIDNVDKFSTSVNSISLFVFNEEGRFVHEFRDESEHFAENYRMMVPLTPGKYKFIAWGNLSGDYTVTNCTPETRIEDFMLELNNVGKKVAKHPSHLFYGGVEDVGIEATGLKYITMDLMKNTNTVHVTTTGLPLDEKEGGNSDDFQCIITSSNGEYHYDNSVTGNQLTYIPVSEVKGKDLISDFVIMRELNDGSTSSHLKIIHTDSSTGKTEVLLDTELTPLLISASITKDLDIDDEFYLDVKFDYTYGKVNITINDWQVVNGNGENIG